MVHHSVLFYRAIVLQDVVLRLKINIILGYFYKVIQKLQNI